MRTINADQVREQVRALYLEMNCRAGEDVTQALEKSMAIEESLTGRHILGQILESNAIAGEAELPLCQDTGMAVLFAELGQEVCIKGDFNEAVNEGVRQAYAEGYFRASVVRDPLYDRTNTGDNTPAVIHLRLIPGDELRLHAMCKGFGSENMSRTQMLIPADGEDGVLRLIRETVESAGPNPCPPVIVGIGIGGTLEKAAELAKMATIRPVGQPNSDPRYAELERLALTQINDLGVGPGGLGGRITALAVHVDVFATHIAGMPVAVNICCHAARHRCAVL